MTKGFQETLTEKLNVVICSVAEGSSRRQSIKKKIVATLEQRKSKQKQTKTAYMLSFA